MANQKKKTPTKRNQKGKIVRTSQKEIIINLYKDLIKNEPEISFENVVSKLSKSSGIGFGTIKNNLREFKKNHDTISSPQNKIAQHTICDKVDDFDKNAIRRKIHAFWLRREIPTFSKIIEAVADDPDLPNLSRSSFQRLLKNMQFEYPKRNKNSALTEQEDLVLRRREYISQIRRYRQEGRTIYYVDETWVNAEDYSSGVWDDKTLKSHRDALLKGQTTGLPNPTSKGKRLIAVHIGSSEGFVESGLLCFKSKKNTSLLHSGMNGYVFFEWFCGILPKLNDNAIIVMDDVPYHSMKKEPIPTVLWKRAEIQQWLESKGEVVTKSLIKFELLQKVKQIKHRFEKYVVDEEAEKQNKIVLRLPPYHRELNPMELAWSVVKEHVKTNSSTFQLDDVRQLLIDGTQRVTPEMWSNFISQTIKEEDKLWQIDYISDEMLEEDELDVLTITPETITIDSD